MIYLGLDLGQSQDPSALAIVERLEPANPHRNLPAWQLSYPARSDADPEPLVVRHVERMELDTRYFGVAKRMAAKTFFAESSTSNIHGPLEAL